MIISLSSCEKHTEEILSDAKTLETKSENQIAAPSFEGVKVEALTSSTARGEERRFLSFNTVADFEKAMASLSSGNLEQWEKYFGFESARKAKDSETLSKEGIEDEYLAAVLSPENVIKVGKWAFRIDVINEIVAVVDASSEKEVARLFDLETKLTEKEGVMLFSTNDDIFADLEAGSTGSITSKNERAEVWGWFCKDRRADRKKDDEHLYYEGGNSNRLYSKVVYQQAGVYFSLLINTEHQWKQAGIAWINGDPNNNSLKYTYYYRYQKRCGDYVSQRSQPAGSYSYVVDNDITNRVFQGTQNLKEYEAEATFYIKYYDAATKTYKEMQSDKLHIIDGY